MSSTETSIFATPVGTLSRAREATTAYGPIPFVGLQSAKRNEWIAGEGRAIRRRLHLIVANATKLLERMRANPRDWRIEEIVTICEAMGIACTAPRKGSHYKVKHPGVIEILTIPAHRPIKPVYIRDLIKFIDAVEGARS